MKKIVFGLLASVLFTSFTFAQDKVEYLKIENLLEKVTELAEKNQNVVNFEIGYDKSQDLYALSNLKVENDDYLIGFIKGYVGSTTFEEMKGKIHITCVLANGDWAETSCSGGRAGASCVASAVSNCLNAGGCATVCSAKAFYIPK